MSRRAVPSRRLGDGGSIPLVGSFSPKSKTSPVLSIVLVLVGAFLIIGYTYSGSGGTDKESVSRMEGVSCTAEVIRAIPVLQKTYGDSMHKVLHVGPESCAVVSKLWKEEDTEAWGVEPYDLEDAESSCKSLVRKGIVRVADIKFPLPYRPKSFSLVIVSDALDYLSPKYLNKTLPDLARVSADGLVIFTGYPGQQRAKLSELSKFGRPFCLNSFVVDQVSEDNLNASSPSVYFKCEVFKSSTEVVLSRFVVLQSVDGIKVKAKLRSASWWIRYFFQMGLEENETAMKKFEQAASKRSYKPSCQIFHVNSYS